MQIRERGFLLPHTHENTLYASSSYVFEAIRQDVFTICKFELYVRKHTILLHSSSITDTNNNDMIRKLEKLHEGITNCLRHHGDKNKIEERMFLSQTDERSTATLAYYVRRSHWKSEEYTGEITITDCKHAITISLDNKGINLLHAITKTLQECINLVKNSNS